LISVVNIACFICTTIRIRREHFKILSDEKEEERNEKEDEFDLKYSKNVLEIKKKRERNSNSREDHVHKGFLIQI
jgi:hypothetical protein